MTQIRSWSHIVLTSCCLTCKSQIIYRKQCHSLKTELCVNRHIDAKNGMTMVFNSCEELHTLSHYKTSPDTATTTLYTSGVKT